MAKFKRLDFAQMTALQFEEPQRDRFPAVDLGYAAARAGGLAPNAANAANEVAVERFLQGALPFTEIMSVVSQAIEEHDIIASEPRGHSCSRWHNPRTNSGGFEVHDHSPPHFTGDETAPASSE